MTFYEWRETQSFSTAYWAFQMFQYCMKELQAANDESSKRSPAQNTALAILNSTEMVSCTYLRKRLGCQYLKVLESLQAEGLVAQEFLGRKKFFKLVQRDESVTVRYYI